MKIYLDTSALNRPFDDRSQVRISLEALAVQSIILLIQERTIDLISSDALAYEVSRNPYPENQTIVREILEYASAYQDFTTLILERGQQLERDNNITQLDALHIACAEAQQVDRFITCDDRLIKRYKNAIIHLCNPVELVLQATQGESR